MRQAKLEDDDDDPWSYTFPQSSDDLTNATTLSKIDMNTDRVTKTATAEDEDKKTTQVEMPANSIAEDDENASQRSSSSSTNGNSAENRRKELASLIPVISQTSSSLSLQSPFAVKSMPADPHTTREDASSIMSKDSMYNGLEDSLNNQQVSSSPYMKAGFFNNVRNSMGKPNSNQDIQEDSSERISYNPRSSTDIDTKEGVVGNSEASPRILSYRKSRRTISSGAFSTGSDELNNKDRFDPRLYIDEFYKDTKYRYATMKRNTEFHQLFTSLDLTERLLDDFSCALSKEILLQGRLYVSENHICFNSNLLGWVTNLVIPMSDVLRIEKKFTAGLFPNGIMLATKDAKHNLASLISRDGTFEFLKKVWEGSTGKIMNDAEESSEFSPSIDDDTENNTPMDPNSPQINSYILSIDEDEDGSSDQVSDIESDNEPDVTTVNAKLVKFKDSSNYVNRGPDFHTPTEIPFDYVKEDNEIELCNEIIEAPLGVVFELLFSSDNTSFHTEMLESQDASEVTDYGLFHPSEDDPKKLERKYEYRKALGYSIGPKSTKCKVSEVIEHMNFLDYAVVVSTTSTPDVPSGNSFVVNTRFCFSWGPNNSTILRMSFIIKWTGKSWIKSVIEKQSLSGQTEAANKLLTMIRDKLELVTYRAEEEITVESTPQALEGIKKNVSQTSVSKSSTRERRKVTPMPPIQLSSQTFLFCLVFFSMASLFILQLKMITTLNSIKDIATTQLMISSRVIQQSASESEEHIHSDVVDKEDKTTHVLLQNNALWEWVNQNEGKEMSFDERVEFLVQQLSSLNTEMCQNQHLDSEVVNSNHKNDCLRSDKKNGLKSLLNGLI